MAEAALAMPAPFTAHGGRVDVARVAFPGTTGWLDLSTGMAPWAYPVEVAAGVQARLPSPDDLTALEAAAASAFASDPAMTVTVPGSDIGLRLIGAILGDRRAAVAQPSFSGHRAMWAAAPTPTGIDDIAVAATAHDVVVLARPTNPDGTIVDVAALEAAASGLARRGGNLVVDEAFADAPQQLRFGLPDDAGAARLARALDQWRNQ